MVRIQGPSDYDRLDTLVHDLVKKHKLRLDVTGWTRKTYTVLGPGGKDGADKPYAQVESFATTNGEIVIYDQAAVPFAEELGGALEQQFGVEEAVVVEKPRPL